MQVEEINTDKNTLHRGIQLIRSEKQGNCPQRTRQKNKKVERKNDKLSSLGRAKISSNNFTN